MCYKRDAFRGGGKKLTRTCCAAPPRISQLIYSAQDGGLVITPELLKRAKEVEEGVLQLKGVQELCWKGPDGEDGNVLSDECYPANSLVPLLLSRGDDMVERTAAELAATGAAYVGLDKRMSCN